MHIFLISLAFLMLIGCAKTSEVNDQLGYRGFVQSGEEVEQTLYRLRQDPSIKITERDGWIIAQSDVERAIWSFTPVDHPAHPAFVKREVIEDDGSVYINTSAKCSAEKIFCDQLVEDFMDLNSKIEQQFRTDRN